MVNCLEGNKDLLTAAHGDQGSVHFPAQEVTNNNLPDILGTGHEMLVFFSQEIQGYITFF
jgi:hypothetical protein